MQKISFNVPTAKGPRVETGYRVWLHVGPGPVWPFVLQIVGNSPSTLADFKSGYKLHDMHNERLAYKVAVGDFRETTLAQWRYLAQNYIQSLVDAKGADAVRAKLASVPQINDMPAQHAGNWTG